MSVLKYFDGTNWNEVNGQIVGDTLPIGTIVPFAGTNIPVGWIECKGQALSRTNYSDLFSAIGTTYGDGDGSTTFNLPDLKGRVLVGQNPSDSDFDTIGEPGGSKTDNLSNAYAKVGRATSSLSTMSYKAHAGSGVTFDRTLQGGVGIDGTVVNASDTSDLGGSVSTLQPYLVTNYIIKVRQIAGLVGSVTNNYSVSQTDTYSCEYVNDLTQDIYSTTEVKTNKVWIDGKPIYRKVFPFTTGSSAADTTYQTNTNNIDIVTSATGFTYDTNTGEHIPLPRTYRDGSGQYIMCLYRANRTEFLITYGTYNTNRSGYVVYEYTKTTD